MQRILIADAYGNVGQETISSLVRKKIPDLELVAGVRNVLKYKGLFTYPKVSMSTVDFSSPESYIELMNGIDKVFLIKPAALSHVSKHIIPFLKSAYSVPVKQILFLSVQGVEKSTTLAHYKIEQELLYSGIPYTILRPSFFMQNFNTVFLENIRKGFLELPEVLNKINLIDVRDIGEAAALCLLDERHHNKIYELNGPQTFNSAEVIQNISRVLDRKIVFAKPSSSRLFYKTQNDKSSAQILGLSSFYSVMEQSTTASNQELTEIIGRNSSDFNHYLKEYRSSWL